MGKYVKTIDHFKLIASGRDEPIPFPFSEERGLRCRRGHVVAILPGVIAAAGREEEGGFVGWYKNEETIFVVYDGNYDYVALDKDGSPAVHPHVNRTDGHICLGDNEAGVEGAIASLLAINLSSVYFMPRLSAEKPADERPLAVIRL
jgi:hypothetical protein